MPALADLQSTMAKSLLSGRWAGLGDDLVAGPVGPCEALAIHRNTALHGLVNALRLGFPTVDALVGEAFFDQAALAFVQDHPPSSAWLTGYGCEFPAFIAAYGPAAGLPYLADVARLDLAIETVAAAAPARDGVSVDLGPVTLTLDGALRLLALDWPALDIRDAVDNGDEALAALDLRPEPHTLVLWRAAKGAAVRRLSPASAAVLGAFLGDGDLSTALANADLAALHAEALSAPFARLTPKPSEDL